MPKQRIGPLQLAGDAARVRIEQQLVRIKAKTALRFVGAIRAIAIDQADLRIRQVAVPYLVSTFGQRISCDLTFARGVENTKIDALGVGRKHREVCTQTVPRG